MTPVKHLIARNDLSGNRTDKQNVHRMHRGCLRDNVTVSLHGAGLRCFQFRFLGTHQGRGSVSRVTVLRPMTGLKRRLSLWQVF